MKSSKILSWMNRNNSDSISAILHPDYYQSSESSSSSSIKTLLNVNTSETCNYCYCRELTNIQPTLFQHPLECYQKKQQQSSCSYHHHHHHHQCYQEKNNGESPRKSLNLRNNLKESEIFYRDFIKQSRNNPEFIEKVYSDDCQNNDDDDHQSIIDLEIWRKSHYFDTHSIDDLLLKTIIPEHTCIHRFKLNQRNLPVSVNQDQYGLSRCLICNKPMITSRIDKKFDNNQIYFSNNDDNIKIELILDDNNSDDGDNNDKKSQLFITQSSGCVTSKLKRPEYSNTLALRYQKGVNWP